MTKKKLETLFSLARELYIEEQKKSGLAVIPYAYAKNQGEMLVFSAHGVCSNDIMKRISKII